MSVVAYHDLVDSLFAVVVFGEPKSSACKLEFAQLARLYGLINVNYYSLQHPWLYYTSSTLPFIMYRTILTVFSCPSRMMRPIAWFSTDGFHCGSMIWTIFAAFILFNLCHRQSKAVNIICKTYPTAPVPSVINRIRTVVDCSKSSSILLLLLAGILPCIRRYEMDF